MDPRPGAAAVDDDRVALRGGSAGEEEEVAEEEGDGDRDREEDEEG